MSSLEYAWLREYALAGNDMEHDELIDELRLSRSGNIDARNRIVEAFMNTVFIVASRYRDSLTRSDAISAGLEELIGLVESFDADKATDAIDMTRVLSWFLIRGLKRPMDLAARNCGAAAPLRAGQWRHLQKNQGNVDAAQATSSTLCMDSIKDPGVDDEGYGLVDVGIDSQVALDAALSQLIEERRVCKQKGDPYVKVDAMRRWYGIGCKEEKLEDIAMELGMTRQAVSRKVIEATEAARKWLEVDHA